METLLTKDCKPNELPPLTLAFVGDGVYDLMVREHLVKAANRSVGELNKRKVSLVCCSSQAKFYSEFECILTEEEVSVYKRGRNAAPNSTPKNASKAEYHIATGVEALFGYLYLCGRIDRIRQIFDVIINCNMT